MNREHDALGRTLTALAAAFLLASALVLTPGPSLYAQSTARTPDATGEAWITGVWSDLGALWSAVWNPASTWLAETTSDGESTSDPDSTDTDTDGGFDPGGEGGLLDPDG